MTPVVKTIGLSTGVQVNYAEQGDPAGAPVVLLHGFTDSRKSFDLVLPHLPASIRAYVITQRGHGDSDRPESGYRSRDFADDIAAFLDAVGLERAVIVGHSMGATNALRFAIDYPNRVSGLLIAATFASYRANPAAMDFGENVVAKLGDPIDPAFVREFQEGTLAQPIPAWFLDAAIQESLKVPARVWREAFQGFLEDDVARDLGVITAPTLIVWGDRDSFCRREDQDALRAALPHARFIVYEKAGHALHWEEPERFAAEMTSEVILRLS
jgi:non-heme chloroperoxidase